MKNFLPIICSSPLFSGLAEEETEAILGCLSASQESLERQQFLLRRGDRTAAMGLVLSGSVHIIREDFWGNRNIIATAGPGELFAETYACTAGATLDVSVVAAETARVMYLEVGRILNTCSPSCQFHERLIRNLLTVLAGKNLLLNEKLIHMAQRSTRDKLLSYLSAEAQRRGSASFTIPFNRQQLADYLSVDRSAMSNELGKMRDEGLLRFDKNSFQLLIS